MNNKKVESKQILAAVVGNALEWYDFVIFGFFTVVISKIFFPSENEINSLLIAMATFGVGFFMRPIGGIFIGIYADSLGRKAALQLIIFLMTISLVLIVITPSYETVGIIAPIIIVFARLMQGFATGGEFASATSFLVESAPFQKRGFYGSLQMVGQSIAVLTGATFGFLITQFLEPNQVNSWGWRVPFIFGLLIAPVGFYIRRNLNETDSFLKGKKLEKKIKIIDLWFENKKSLLVSFGLVVSGTIMFYVVLIYMPTYAKLQLNIPLNQAFIAQVIGLVFLTLGIPIFGTLSDRLGRRKILLFASFMYLCLPFPLMYWLNSDPSLLKLIIMQTILCSTISIGFGAISTALAEQFTVRVRSTGLAIGYNFAVMIFGGFAQFIVTWLINYTNNPLAPSFYVMFGAIVGITSSLFMIDNFKDKNFN